MGPAKDRQEFKPAKTNIVWPPLLYISQNQSKTEVLLVLPPTVPLPLKRNYDLRYKCMRPEH